LAQAAKGSQTSSAVRAGHGVRVSFGLEGLGDGREMGELQVMVQCHAGIE
jgi:hypothetical protein